MTALALLVLLGAVFPGTQPIGAAINGSNDVVSLSRSSPLGRRTTARTVAAYDTEANGSSMLGRPTLPGLLDSQADTARGGAWLEDDLRVTTPRLPSFGVRMRF